MFIINTLLWFLIFFAFLSLAGTLIDRRNVKRKETIRRKSNRLSSNIEIVRAEFELEQFRRNNSY